MAEGSCDTPALTPAVRAEPGSLAGRTGLKVSLNPRPGLGSGTQAKAVPGPVPEAAGRRAGSGNAGHQAGPGPPAAPPGPPLPPGARRRALRPRPQGARGSPRAGKRLPAHGAPATLPHRRFTPAAPSQFSPLLGFEVGKQREARNNSRQGCAILEILTSSERAKNRGATSLKKTPKAYPNCLLFRKFSNYFFPSL